MNDRLLSLLGLCRRAGKIVIGADPVIDSVLNGKSYVVLMAKDFSHNSKKSVEINGDFSNMKIIESTAERKLDTVHNSAMLENFTSKKNSILTVIMK